MGRACFLPRWMDPWRGFLPALRRWRRPLLPGCFPRFLPSPWPRPSDTESTHRERTSRRQPLHISHSQRFDEQEPFGSFFPLRQRDLCAHYGGTRNRKKSRFWVSFNELVWQCEFKIGAASFGLTVLFSSWLMQVCVVRRCTVSPGRHAGHGRLQRRKEATEGNFEKGRQRSWRGFLKLTVTSNGFLGRSWVIQNFIPCIRDA